MITYIILSFMTLALAYFSWYASGRRLYFLADVKNIFFFVTNVVFTAVFLARLETMFFDVASCIMSILFIALSVICYYRTGRHIVYYMKLVSNNYDTIFGILRTGKLRIFSAKAAVEHLLTNSSDPSIATHDIENYDKKLIHEYGTYWWKISKNYMVSISGVILFISIGMHQKYEVKPGAGLGGIYDPNDPGKYYFLTKDNNGELSIQHG